MTTTATDARAAVAQRAQNTGQVQQSQPQQSPQEDLAAFVQSNQAELARAVPEHLDAGRIARIALTSLRTTKHLAECTKESFAGALMTCAQLGLEPGGPAGEAWLVPFWSSKLKRYEVQLVIGYPGMVKLFWQSPQAAGLDSRTVKENDYFEYHYGLEPVLKHIPARGNRGRSIAWYSVARTINGASFLVMYREDIEEIRKRSRAKDDGPWQTDYDAMAKKTTLRQLFKTMPKSAVLSRAIAHDETIRTDRSLEAIDTAPTYQPRELTVGPSSEDDVDWSDAQ